MARLVQSPALGLLSLFTCKDGGIGPNALSDSYIATVDARPMLGAAFRRTFTLSLVAANINVALAGAPGWYRFNDEALGIAAGFRCPSDEIWRVISFGYTIQTVTGSTSAQAGWDFAAIGGAAGDPFCTAIAEITAGAAAGVQRASGYQADFWALPGQGPAAHFPQWTLGVNDADMPGVALTVERYKI